MFKYEIKNKDTLKLIYFMITIFSILFLTLEKQSVLYLKSSSEFEFYSFNQTFCESVQPQSAQTVYETPPQLK
jgi:hypothetical protein